MVVLGQLKNGHLKFVNMFFDVFAFLEVRLTNPDNACQSGIVIAFKQKCSMKSKFLKKIFFVLNYRFYQNKTRTKRTKTKRNIGFTNITGHFTRYPCTAAH